MLKAIETYYAIRNSALETAETETVKQGIMAAVGDDGRILAKIIEVAFVPISPALAREIAGDTNQYGIRDVGKALNQGFAAFATAVRLMAKADIMEMVNDLFELALNGTEHFVNREARCLGSFEEYATERITVFEKKHGPITGKLYLKTCKARALLQDSKGDSTVKECNRLLEHQQQFQKVLLSWDTLSSVFDEYYKAHVEYEKDNGEQKFIVRNKNQLLLLTNGDVPEKEGAGGLRKKGMAMVGSPWKG